ncbi:putative leucine-rich repeat-containing protein DDB_G0290503 isoform X2 [Schistocerca gregaria]|uniref:putative leucine-rich repeat-containing protein DDB_G0290503 isoform X2 n=1 Tax=Schistocerca gregaria TaxID=7010 RepID=UPI00211EFAF5|nr:putative leucine-rich repeat-containing protein DDB_G0290503 isoform X2 [Schistocerca gregaria]
MLSCEFGMPTLKQSSTQIDDRSDMLHDQNDIGYLVRNEIQDAEKKLVYLGEIIAGTKEKLSAFHRKGNLSDPEQRLVKEYEQEIQDRLNELHDTSRRIQTLIGLTNSDLERLINSTEASEQNEVDDNNTISETTSEVSSVSEPFIDLGTLFNDSDTEEAADSLAHAQLGVNEVNQILETISEEEVPNEDAHEWISVNTAVTEALQCVDIQEKFINILTKGELMTGKPTHDSDDGAPKIVTVCEKRNFSEEEEEEDSKMQTLKNIETSFCTEDGHKKVMTLCNTEEIKVHSSRNVADKSEDAEFGITNEIQEAEKKLTYLGEHISFVKDKLNLFQEKGELTEIEQKQVDKYKDQIKNKLNELHKTSKRLQVLIGVSNTDLKHLINSDEEQVEFEGHDRNVINEMINIKSSVSETPANLEPSFNSDNNEVDEISSSLNHPVILENEVTKTLETISEEEVVSDGFREWIAVNTVIPELKNQIKDTKRANNFFSNEELFPKVVICGSEGGDPKIIFCDQTNSTSDFPVIVTQLPYFLHKILSMREKSLIEIENLQNKRYYLQQELSEKDHAVEELLGKVNKLETELSLISKKNISLKEKVNMAHSMEKRSDKVENHLHTIQTDKEEEIYGSEQYEQQSTASSDTAVNFDEVATEERLSYVKEEYNKMLEEYTIRERELEILHGQMSEQNGDEHQVRELLASSETEMLELEGRLHALRTQTNEVALYQEKVTQSEQNLITSKIMYFKVQDQAEKCRVLIKEHAQETEKYRKKYLKTQQAADDLRRQMEVKETESNHIHSQVSMEISLVQNQFQEQLQLLSSIPDAVNKLQLQVQEEEQQWCMAEFRRRELMHELYDAKQQMDCYTKEINEIQVRLQESKDEQKELHKQLKNCEKENEELQNEVSALNCPQYQHSKAVLVIVTRPEAIQKSCYQSMRWLRRTPKKK